MNSNSLTSEAKYYLNVLEALVSSDFDIEITHHSKAIRDIMDNLEGHLHGCLNKNKRYSHSILKHDAPHMSVRAKELRKKVRQGEFLRNTHRDHAKPFKVVVQEIKGLKGQELLEYVLLNIKSVTILNEEQKLLDNTFKDKMPNRDDIFSRYKAIGIEVICRKDILQQNISTQPATTTLHLADTDMIVFYGLIENKMEKLRKELFNQRLTTSEEFESLKALKDQFLKADHEITSSNNF